jgi:hypothetical protein
MRVSNGVGWHIPIGQRKLNSALNLVPKTYKKIGRFLNNFWQQMHQNHAQKPQHGSSKPHRKSPEAKKKIQQNVLETSLLCPRSEEKRNKNLSAVDSGHQAEGLVRDSLAPG